jgi:hypothetical protein
LLTVNLRPGFAIDVGDGESPERHEVDAGDELGGERGQLGGVDLISRKVELWNRGSRIE